MSTLFLIYLRENTDKGRLPPGDQQNYDIKRIKHVKLGPNLKDREYSNSLIQHNVEVLQSFCLCVINDWFDSDPGASVTHARAHR